MLLLTLACLCGLGIDAPTSAPRDRIVRCAAKIDPGREVVTYLWDVESRGSDDADVDHEPIGERVLWTAAPGRYRVELIVGYAGGGIERARTDVVIEGDPSPPTPVPPTPPTPNPRPEGFAGEVYDRAKTIGRAADCVRMAGDFRTVGSAVAAGSYTPAQAVEELERLATARALPPQFWGEFGRWLAEQLTARVKDRGSAATTLQAVADGLDAAARVMP